MNLSTKLQPVFIISAALIGLLLGGGTSFGDYSVGLVEPFLMALLFMVFLSVDLKSIKEAFTNYKFTVTSLLVNFVWTPIFAVLLGMIFLHDSLDLQVGFLMLLVTPCTDWYLVFTGLSKGNVALATAVLPLNLILQVALLPIYLFTFYGSKVGMDGADVLWSIIIVLVIPMVLAQLVKLAARKMNRLKAVVQGLLDRSDNLQLVFLCIAVIAMFASEGKALLSNPLLLVQMLAPLACFFTINFLLVYAIAKRLRMSFYDTVPLIITTLARNSPLSLAIAVAAFPDRPLISLALVIGPLIELPVLGIVSSILLRLGKRQQVQ
ncbi:arsenic resistance protein [Enterococcus sp. AZ072]|uniref:arsenic resistance protein n=1 Tax=unclassified Enterococcus TaxID=2608891 RepID=UPI003D2E2093